MNKEEEHKWSEEVLDGAPRHRNGWVGCVGGDDVRKEVVVFTVMFIDGLKFIFIFPLYFLG